MHWKSLAAHQFASIGNVYFFNIDLQKTLLTASKTALDWWRVAALLQPNCRMSSMRAGLTAVSGAEVRKKYGYVFLSDSDGVTLAYETYSVKTEI